MLRSRPTPSGGLSSSGSLLSSDGLGLSALLVLLLLVVVALLLLLLPSLAPVSYTHLTLPTICSV